jgi:hypothetical protein
VLDDLGNPDAVTLSVITNSAPNDDFGEWLRDRKNRRVIPHRMEACGYVPVRNDTARDGYYVVSEKRQAVYAKATLPMEERRRAARRLVEGKDGAVWPRKGWNRRNR